MNTIIEEVDKLTILVNDILTLSKMQSDIDKLSYSKFDLTKLIKDIIKRYNILKETENYHFIYDNNKKLIVQADQKN